MTRPGRLAGTLAVIAIVIICLSSITTAQDTEGRLSQWLKGVWLSGNGTYSIYTDNHYFVVSVEGDSSNANVYCGASQIVFSDQGMARRQVMRLRQVPGGDLLSFRESDFLDGMTEKPLAIDTALFKPGICNIKDGVIYDSITEVGKDFILLATCNGDRIKVYANGVYEYLPSGGGSFKSYRIEGL